MKRLRAGHLLGDTVSPLLWLEMPLLNAMEQVVDNLPSIGEYLPSTRR